MFWYSVKTKAIVLKLSSLWKVFALRACVRGPSLVWTKHPQPLDGDSSIVSTFLEFRFVPSGEEECLKDRFGTLVYDIRSEELKDPEKYPSYSKLQKSFTVIQNSGEIIFVPSVWHHQVHNLVSSRSLKKKTGELCQIGKLDS